jgi:hypothetical protein
MCKTLDITNKKTILNAKFKKCGRPWHGRKFISL